MLLVALNQGVFFQKCLDPDCRSMDYRYGSRARAFLGSNRVLAAAARSPPWPLPDDLLPPELQHRSQLQQVEVDDSGHLDAMLLEAMKSEPELWP